MTFSPELTSVVDDVLGASEAGQRGGSDLFATVAELGWLLVAVPEEAGGSGGDLADLAEIAAGLGRHGVVLPIVETATTQWLHARLTGHVYSASPPGAVLSVPDEDEITLARAGDHWVVDGCLRRRRGLEHAGFVVVLALDRSKTPRAVVLAVPMDDSTMTANATADEFDDPVHDLILSGTKVPAEQVLTLDGGLDEWAEPAAARLRLLSAATMVGAAETACSLTARHVESRNQFGRPLARLQAVSHALAAMVAERDLMTAAVHRAIDSGGDERCVAAACSVVARSAGLVAAGAHQLHGAIGITKEYPLHLVTRTLWLRRDLINQRSSELAVGMLAAEGTESDVWALVVGSEA